jgi:DNA-binding LacI/PurR family transcriptional regulator
LAQKQITRASRRPVIVKELLRNRKIEGIICANDYTAALLMHSLAKAKIRVPEDMRLMGFDDLKYAELLATPLTTVSQPYRDLVSQERDARHV